VVPQGWRAGLPAAARPAHVDGLVGPDALADELVALPPEALCARVAEAGGERLGKLELVTPPRPSAAPDARRGRRQPRLALIGDAAHAIHPLSGHGINLGYQDARVLAGQLAGLPAWRDPGELPVLRAYARARAEETALLQYTTHGLNRLFKPADPLLSGLRNLGLNLTNRLRCRYATRFLLPWRTG
jgi:2-polyprenyl-6-methoxyphenol hydroxylase-like FAD-dependent oxidoreductase